MPGASTRKLKLWNGRWGRKAHVFACAYSVPDLLALIKELYGFEPYGMRGEIRTYWSAGHWGNSMAGITPERGLWVMDDRRSTPVRVQPGAEYV